MKWSNILLYSGLAILLAGAIMSTLGIEPYSDYVLIAGALVVIFRGAVRSRERIEEQDKNKKQ
jgi:membrane protein implicated in regulation of membrane protease activity